MNQCLPGNRLLHCTSPPIAEVAIVAISIVCNVVAGICCFVADIISAPHAIVTNWRGTRLAGAGIARFHSVSEQPIATVCVDGACRCNRKDHIIAVIIISPTAGSQLTL